MDFRYLYMKLPKTIFPEDSECLKHLEEVSEKTYKAIIEKFSVIPSFKDVYTTLTVLVSPEDMCKVRLHPSIIVEYERPTKSLFDDEDSFNAITYHKSILYLEGNIKIHYVITPFYRGEPTCNLDSIFKRGIK